MRSITFHVPGIPVPQGSHRAFVNPRTGRAIITQANAKTRPWRDSVRCAAAEAMGSAAPAVTGYAVVSVRFVFPRPKSHYRTGKHAGELRPDAPYYHTVKPDVDKLERALFDAITGTVWRDDSMAASVAKSKVYAGGDTRPGAYVTVQLHEENGNA